MIRIAFANWEITWQTLDGQDGLAEYLSANCPQHIQVGGPPHARSEFSAVIMRSCTTGATDLGIGIRSESHGLAPMILAIPERKRILFGVNSEVVALNAESARIEYEFALDSPFHTFLGTNECCGAVCQIVSHELGVVAIDETGQARWRAGGDIVECIGRELDQLHLTFMDDPALTVNIRTGEIAERRD